ncbi:macrophage mannose receptor 1-like [Stylophora pistillata]|uniref:macrophage mannose receptor 1-like n=1 Tax=Stylophora pistillata TaxID=50429 RepID=UPI000C04AEBA|nr:macrophage mannose receptor 1-like [Stylophora pistillata]
MLTSHLFKVLVVCVLFLLIVCKARNISGSAYDICHPGRIRWNNTCYFFANNSASNRVAWQDARQTCQRIRGGDLVSIHSAAENNFIALHISDNYWIGLNDLRTEGNLQWSDGSSLVYSNYQFGEPNDHYGQEDCMEMRGEGQWNDLNCGRNLGYVCKQTKNPSAIPQALVPTLGQCEDGWVKFEKSCYRSVSDPPLSWRTARDVCRKRKNASMHGDLVTVNNQQEQEFSNTILRKTSTDFWIGLNDLITEGRFVWTDNSPRRYTNWNGSALSKHDQQSLDCVHMNPHKDEGRWRTASCDQKKGFICETEAHPILPTSGQLLGVSMFLDALFVVLWFHTKAAF